jgi:hypothetical protein
MPVVFALLVAFFAIALSTRKFTNKTHLLLIGSICVMLALITFTHYGG